MLFLNNALNHGVLTPLGIQQAVDQGSSVLFLLEANPGPGLGLLLAYSLFGTGLARSTAPGAAIIHFFGGIHEIYFPYVLMKPLTLLALIPAGAVGIGTLVVFDAGLRAPAAPGSIIAVLAQTPGSSLVGVRAVGGARGGDVLRRRLGDPARHPRQRRGRPGRRHRLHGGDEGQAEQRRRRPGGSRVRRALPAHGHLADRLRLRRRHGLERHGRQRAAQQGHQGRHRATSRSSTWRSRTCRTTSTWSSPTATSPSGPASARPARSTSRSTTS